MRELPPEFTPDYDSFIFNHPDHLRLQADPWINFYLVKKANKKDVAQVSFHSHQGHMHIGVCKDFRGQQVGHKLVNFLVDYAKGQNVDEITASVHDGNRAACRFFEHLGFVARDRYPMIMALGKTVTEYHSISYVKTIH